MDEQRRKSVSQTMGPSVSSQLVFQTKSFHKGRERDFIDLQMNDNVITTTTLLPGEYQLLLEGLRLFSGMLRKGIGVVIDYNITLSPFSPSSPLLQSGGGEKGEGEGEGDAEGELLDIGRMVGSSRHPEFRKILDFRVEAPSASHQTPEHQQQQPTGVVLQIKAKRHTKTMNGPRLRARLIRRVENKDDKGLPNTFDPLTSQGKSAVEELFGHCRPEIGNMLQNLYKNSDAYRHDNALQQHRLQMAHNQNVWWPKEGEELWSEKTRMSYTLQKKIGEGGYGVAFLSVDFYGQRYVAKASKTFFSKEKVEEEWRKETKLMLAVQHPNVVQLYDAFTWSGLYWVVIEECEGSFAKYVAERGCLSSSETILVAGQLLSALEHIHSRGIIHRDVQMDNVLYSTSLFTKTIIVKLTDFGISKFIGEGSALVAYTSVGRAYDMSPEVAQMEGGFTVGVSDVYQLGLVLFNVLTGNPALSEADGPPLEAIHSGLARERAENIGTQLGGVIAMMLRRSIPHRLTVRDAWLRLKAIQDNPDAPFEKNQNLPDTPVPDFSLNPEVPQRRHARQSRRNLYFEDFSFEEEEEEEEYGGEGGGYGGGPVHHSMSQPLPQLSQQPLPQQYNPHQPLHTPSQPLHVPSHPLPTPSQPLPSPSPSQPLPTNPIKKPSVNRASKRENSLSFLPPSPSPLLTKQAQSTDSVSYSPNSSSSPSSFFPPSPSPSPTPASSPSPSPSPSRSVDGIPPSFNRRQKPTI